MINQTTHQSSMSAYPAVVAVFPGTNCENETAAVLKELGFEAQIITWTSPEVTIKEALAKACLVVIPGGFSYGDYLRAGAVAARDHLMNQIGQARERGAFILGICNGFQILCEAKWLPGALMPNRQGVYLHRLVECDVQPNIALDIKTPHLSMQIAHYEGRFLCSDSEWEQLKAQKRIVLRYTKDQNGARDQTAGICSEDGRVVGLMPHPERVFFGWHETQDGKAFFEALKTKVVSLFQ
jgi:phosphoribosylformylglycinamidine synthase